MKWTANKVDMDFQPVITDEEGNEVAVVLSGKAISPAKALMHAKLISMIPELIVTLEALVAEEDGPIIFDGHDHPDTKKAKQLLSTIQNHIS